MWSFKRWRSRKNLRAAFTRHLADEVIDELIKHPRPLQMAPQPASICFILLQVRDDPVADAPEHMAKAFDIIARRNGTVWGVASSIALASFGAPFSEDAERDLDQRSKSIVRLVTELGADIRMVYGTADGLIGNFGAPQRFYYGPLLPGFGRYLGALTSLEFGQSVEMAAT